MRGAKSGVIACLCARHMMAMAGGIADLEKGERCSRLFDWMDTQY